MIARQTTPNMGFASPAEQALAEMARVDLLLRRHILRLRALRLLNDESLRGVAIPDNLVDALLDQQEPSNPSQPPDELLAQRAQLIGEQIEHVRQQNNTRARASLSASMVGTPLPMAHLARVFGLNRFDVDILWLAAAAQLQSRYGTLFAYAHNDLTRPWLSVDLALQLLCESLQEQLERRSAFAPNAPLVRHHLLRLSNDRDERESTFLSRSVIAEERIANFLLGSAIPDARLFPFTHLEEEPQREAHLHHSVIDPLTQAVKRASQVPCTLITLEGPYGSGKLDAARTAMAQVGKRLLVADMRQALSAGQPLDTTFALLLREGALQGAAIYLAHLEGLLADANASQHLAALQQALSRIAGCEPLLIFIGTEATWCPQPPWPGVAAVHLQFGSPAYPERLQAWQRALNAQSPFTSASVDLPALASQYVLSQGQIDDAARVARQSAALRGADEAITMDDLRHAAISQSNQNLQRIAQKVTPVYGWDDIVLPPSPMRQLREAYATLRHRQVVLSQWCFERKMAMGKGTAILFAGPSGTGKTMAAQILAHELGLDLYKVDLSTLVSKYIGETEKNLSQIFKEAQTSNAILFFDEADALFGKRSEVKDAHDRYANIEIAFLLQRVEEYDGAVILASNLNQNMDDAFRRRLRHFIEFPFPDAQHRERIWRTAFPPQAPLDSQIDFGFVARQFELSGGNIRNAAFAAATLAAEAGTSISMEHLMLAVLRELQKMGKLPSRNDFRQYYDLLRERG